MSFRHGVHELTQRFVRELHDGLSAELEAQLGLGVGVFLDQQRLQGGDLFNEQIARDLCESSCLVMIYTPSYFSLEHSYCAREFKGMVQLEQNRLQLLEEAERTHGLIIPVIFRGEKRLPAEIRNQRQYYDFSDFTLTKRTMSAHPRYSRELKAMGEYIADRHRRLAAVVDEDHNAFALPSLGEIGDWLTGIVPDLQALPGRMHA
jgi:hypothetical protein